MGQGSATHATSSLLNYFVSMQEKTLIRTTSQSPSPITILDICIIICCLVGAVILIPSMSKAHPVVATIYIDNKPIARYPLGQDLKLALQGREGEVVAVIAQNSIQITQASCPNHLCIQTGAIHRPGQQIVCAPNHLLIQIHSPETNSHTPDAIVQ